MASKTVGRVVVGVNGSPGSLEALRFALGQARVLAVTLMPVLAWRIPGGELAARRSPSYAYAEALRELSEEQLVRAFNEGLGGVPEDLPIESWVVRGEPGPALVQAAERSNDLLVIGAGRRGRLRHAVHGATARYCLAHATCPVIAVPPPPLQARLQTPWRRRATIDHLLDDLARAHTG